MTISSSLPYNLQNGTTADASQVMADFTQIQEDVNANAAHNGVNSDITQLSALARISSVVSYDQSPQVPTVAPGDSSLDAASTAFVTTALQKIYPIGSLYFNSSSATNPATLLGFGTWVAFAAGRIPIGVGTGTDSNSNTKTIAVGDSAGEYTHTLQITEMPSHTHTDSGHTHGIDSAYGLKNNGAVAAAGSPSAAFTDLTTTATGYASLTNTGGGGAHNNMQPYIGVYIWTRTA